MKRKPNGYFGPWILKLVIYIILISAILYGALFWGVLNELDEFLKNIDFSKTDAFFTQCQITFIVVSFVAFLSGGTEDVLWEDTIGFSLINPRFFNINDATIYLIGTLLCSILWLFFGNEACIFILFGICIILLICIIYKLIGAFFDKDKIRTSLVSQYSKYDLEKKKNVLKMLEEKTLQQIDAKKNKYVRINIDFLVGKQEGVEVLNRIMSYLTTQNGELFFEFCNTYSLLEKKEIYIIANSLCEKLIENKDNNDLNKRLVEKLYSNPRIIVLEGLCISPGQLLEKYGDDWWRYDDLSEYNEIRENVLQEVKNNIQNIEKPIGLLYAAYINRNIDIFEYLLNYLVEQKIYSNNEINEKYKINIFSGQTTIWGVVGNSKLYFLSEKDRDRLNQIINMDDRHCFLLEDQKVKIRFIMDVFSSKTNTEITLE